MLLSMIFDETGLDYVALEVIVRRIQHCRSVVNLLELRMVKALTWD